MPKCKPLTQSQRNAERWRKADDNFRMQVGALMGKSGLTTVDLTQILGVSLPTLHLRLSQPQTMRKSEERLLAQTFERYGMRYDPTLGEGVGA